MNTPELPHGIVRRVSTRVRVVADSLGDQRGVALPLAMFVLAFLMALTLAFSSLATTEPSIARNHSMAAQARAHAESGIERAIWALTSNALTFTSPPTADAPYNGSSFMRVSVNGGFTVSVAEGTTANERNVTAVGWAPDDTGQNRAVRKIQATIARPRWSSVIPPCALCVMGALEVGKDATIDARANHCAGGMPQGGSMTTGATTIPPPGHSGKGGKIWGAGNDVANEPAPEGGVSPDLPAGVGDSNFGFKMTADDFAMLRNMAKAAGTYYQGSRTFDEDRNGGDPMPDGIVFVDTTTGADLTASTPDAEAAVVEIKKHTRWSGWLIVAGSIKVKGSVGLTGTLYAQNDFTFTGNGTITGAVISENRKDSIATLVDVAVEHKADIIYDCPKAQSGGGTIADGWLLKAGTFREVEGQ